jgi:hypothetical protein
VSEIQDFVPDNKPRGILTAFLRIRVWLKRLTSEIETVEDDIEGIEDITDTFFVTDSGVLVTDSASAVWV